MKIVSFGDVHMAIQAMAKIAVELATADLIVLSGDLTNVGGVAEARRVVEAARAYCPTVLALPGNLDRPEVIDFLRAEQMSLHGESRRFGDLGFFGCGGSNITPFHTPLEYQDEELRATIEHAYATVRDAPLRIMVCHTPPYGTKVDRLTDGRPVGSPAVRQFILEQQPHVCITGHIHESAGVDHIGRTPILNAGPFAAGGYIVVRYDKGKADAELKFASA
jgi:Icc-related predicted phosphoesterase